MPILIVAGDEQYILTRTDSDRRVRVHPDTMPVLIVTGE
jgi:hypothetical protein